jgi:hypothetical protein
VNSTFSDSANPGNTSSSANASPLRTYATSPPGRWICPTRRIGSMIHTARTPALSQSATLAETSASPRVGAEHLDRDIRHHLGEALR